MDPTLFALAHKLQSEMPMEDEQHHASSAEQGNIIVLHWLGSLLVSAGEKLQVSKLKAQAVSEVGGYPSLDHDLCV
jgi:hypothetical protein